MQDLELTKKERRKLKREQKRLKRKQGAVRERLMKWGSILGVVALLVGGVFIFRYWNQKRFENPPKIQITPKTYNFGKVLASKGTVETSFEVKNVGVSPLIISGMETSCGCTKAKLKIKDQKSKIRESPEFGMHGNPTNWSTSIEPGETAKLVAIFDPNYHQVFGPVTRTVSIFSNDPWKKEEKVTIYADVER